MRGCIDMGRFRCSSTSAWFPKPAGGFRGGCSGQSSRSELESWDRDLKYSDLACTTRGLSVVRGGNLLILLSAFALCSSCFASIRLCSANASSGDSSGGASPATWSRGDFSGREMEVCDCDRRSIKVGREGAAMVTAATQDHIDDG